MDDFDFEENESDSFSVQKILFFAFSQSYVQPNVQKISLVLKGIATEEITKDELKAIAINDLQDESNLEGVACGNTATSTSSNIAGGRLEELKKDLDKKAWQQKVFKQISNCIFFAKDDKTKEDKIYKVSKQELEQISTHLCQDGAQFLSDKDLRTQFQIDIPKRKKTYEFEWEKEADESDDENEKEWDSIMAAAQDTDNTINNNDNASNKNKPSSLDDEFDILASGTDNEIEVVSANEANGKASSKQPTNMNHDTTSVDAQEKNPTVDENDLINDSYEYPDEEEEDEHLNDSRSLEIFQNMYLNAEPEDFTEELRRQEEENEANVNVTDLLRREIFSGKPDEPKKSSTEAIKVPLGKLLKENHIPKMKIILGPKQQKEPPKPPGDRNVPYAPIGTDTKVPIQNIAINPIVSSAQRDMALRKRLMRNAPVSEIIIKPVNRVERRNMSYWIHYNTRGNVHFNTFGKNSLMSKEKWTEELGPRLKVEGGKMEAKKEEAIDKPDNSESANSSADSRSNQPNKETGTTGVASSNENGNLNPLGSSGTESETSRKNQDSSLNKESESSAPSNNDSSPMEVDENNCGPSDYASNDMVWEDPPPMFSDNDEDDDGFSNLGPSSYSYIPKDFQGPIAEEVDLTKYQDHDDVVYRIPLNLTQLASESNNAIPGGPIVASIKLLPRQLLIRALSEAIKDGGFSTLEEDFNAELENRYYEKDNFVEKGCNPIEDSGDRSSKSNANNLKNNKKPKIESKKEEESDGDDPSDSDGDTSDDDDKNDANSETSGDEVVPGQEERPNIYITNTDKPRIDHCFICLSIIRRTLSDHLITRHIDNEDVKKLAEKKKESNDWHQSLAILRNRGNFEYDIKVLTSGKGEFIVAKRPSPRDLSKNPERLYDVKRYLPCIFCLGFYYSKHLCTHIAKTCPLARPGIAKYKAFIREGRRLLITATKPDMSENITSLISEVEEDEIGFAVKNDWLIVAFGEMLLDKYENKYRGYIRQRMRQLARLLIFLQKMMPGGLGGDDVSMIQFQEFFVPEKFNMVVTATKALADSKKKFNKDKSRLEQSGISNLPLKLGGSLRRCCAILRGKAMRLGDTVDGQELLEKTAGFLNLMDTEWYEKITRRYSRQLHERKLDKVDALPVTRDMQRVVEGVKNDIDKIIKAFRKSAPDIHVGQYRMLAEAVLMRLIVFNMRRPGEMSRMTVQDWRESQVCRNTLEDIGMMDSLSDLEKRMARNFLLIRIKGKCQRHCACLVPPDAKEGLELLVQYRSKVGVFPENPMVFAVPEKMCHIQAKEVLRAYTRKYCEYPEQIRGTKLRKYLATACQILDLGEEGKDYLANHLGHTVKVHTSFYRKHHDAVEVAKVSQILLLAESGRLPENVGKSLSNLNVNEMLVENEMMNDYENGKTKKDAAILRAKEAGGADEDGEGGEDQSQPPDVDSDDDPDDPGNSSKQITPSRIKRERDGGEDEDASSSSKKAREEPPNADGDTVKNRKALFPDANSHLERPINDNDKNNKDDGEVPLGLSNDGKVMIPTDVSAISLKDDGRTTVQCQLCDKRWTGKITFNFVAHMVLKHFKSLWDQEIPENSASYDCYFPDCSYTTGLRYNLLFHLAGKHKQLREKLILNGISEDVLTPKHVEGGIPRPEEKKKEKKKDILAPPKLKVKNNADKNANNKESKKAANDSGSGLSVRPNADGWKSAVGASPDDKVASMPPGWKKEVVTRQNGQSAGHYDVYIYSPGGKKFRSRKELERYCSERPHKHSAEDIEKIFLTEAFSRTSRIRATDEDIQGIDFSNIGKSNEGKVSENVVECMNVITEKEIETELEDQIEGIECIANEQPSQQDQGVEKEAE